MRHGGARAYPTSRGLVRGVHVAVVTMWAVYFAMVAAAVHLGSGGLGAY